ncbi:hypothetical protein QYF68_26860 [Mycolicibacterium austroafricanum]|uniref:DUF3987 domain-containing protein n=1 Tax=Mycolicibacterium austroafricanum TaxID=39687 RepID=A0ABT8HKZ1_MYCAO|nr:hypothetical protein [Mycolicibacterium austroafricanum]MDN4521416.1 hypothetical protein [Mycolicibacterium austroafricanum]
MNYDPWGPTEEFFLGSDSTQLERIYLWARARYAAPWAVFFAVLLRVAASVGPHVQLPGVIGGRASLNLLCAFVSPSGGGKGISDKVGRLAWPVPIVELPIGSGEGIAETFTVRGKESEGNERITAAIFNCSEIDILTGLESRQGSTTLGTLKAFAMGEQFGSTNASKANSRNVPAHSYRGCLSVGAQPGHTGVIFKDTSGGTPQRFLWALTIDPHMPPDVVRDPEPLDTTLPAWEPGPDGVVEIVYGHEEITKAIIGAHLARQRGDADALDGHAMLSRCKVAAVLAIMHGRSVVGEWDWQRSGEVMAVSNSTRDWILAEAQKAARAKVRARALDRAAGEEFYDASRLETVKRSLLRMLDRDGEQAGGDLRRRLGRREKRELFDQAIGLLEAEGLVSARAGEHNSVRYRIGSPVTKEVTPKKASSDGVTTEVTRDHPATVTDLDSRRSQEAARPKLSCLKWLTEYVDQLRAEGHTTVESFAVIEAGHAAGYTTSSIHQARTSHPDMRTISRKRGRAIWSIVPDQRPPRHESAAAWLDNWLDKQTTNTVSPNDAKLAGQAAGHPWQSVRRAAGLSPRITSVPAHGDAKTERVWHISDADGVGA